MRSKKDKQPYLSPAIPELKFEQSEIKNSQINSESRIPFISDL